MRKKISNFFILSIVVFLAGSCVGVPRDGKSLKVYDQVEKNFQAAQTVKYQGENGKTALAILKEKYQVKTKDYSGIGEFVEGISGISPGSKHFWAFYVNGQPATVGASSFMTKDSDMIEWKLEEIKN